MARYSRLAVALWAGIQLMSGSALPAGAADLPSYELDTVIQLAIERNPLMTEAQGLIDQTQGQQIAAGAYPNPTLYGQSGRGAIRDPSTGDSITEYAVSVGQPLEWPGKRAARQRAADAGFAGAGAGFSEKRLNLMAEVRIAFDELLFAQRQAELAEQNLGIVEDVKRIVTTRVRLGEAPQFEAIKAQVEVLKANQVVTRARNTVRVTRVALDTLTAGALGRTYAIKGDFRRVPGELLLEELVASMLKNHPSLNRLARQVERADYTVDFERQARVPNVTVGGGYWREIGREAVTANLSVPVPIWYQQKGEIASALGIRRQQEAELLRMRNELLRAVNLHYQDAQTTADLIRVFEEGLLKQAEEALRIAQFSFRQGASSLLEVLDAQRVQRQILFDYTQARFDLSISLTRLERSIGGSL
ncbi:MAG: TolC family protein [Nitrospiraceae bacterium]